MRTIHLNFRGVHTTPPPSVCCACGAPNPTGVISYGGKVHEPHCDECCKAWELILALHGHGMLVCAITMDLFREWQAQRAGTA